VSHRATIWQVTITAPDLAGVDTAAETLADLINPPLLIKVSGELGAGKTTLISAILKKWNIAGANSPTFNLRNDYATSDRRVVHLDFYRLKTGDAGWDLLPPDEDYSDAVVFAEWPDKAQPQLFAAFPTTATLEISIRPDGARDITWRNN
jgi:tRNA threonylcarbamoyladenosine biosynthesis protein TsaE